MMYEGALQIGIESSGSFSDIDDAALDASQYKQFIASISQFWVQNDACAPKSSWT